MRIKKLVPVIIVVLLIIAILAGIFIYYVFSRENIVYENVDNSADNVSVDEAKNSTPIILNNILMGGVYNKKFVSSEQYFKNSSSISNIDLGLYSMSGKSGTYQLNSLERGGSSNVIYATTSRLNYTEEYIGVIDSNDMTSSFFYEANNKEEYFKNIVKKAISGFLLPNSSVRVIKAYQGTLDDNRELKIVTATSDGNESKGVYSAIVAEVNGKVIPIKLNYIKNTNLSSSWPVYNLKFIYDLNQDGINEIIIEEVDEFNVKYSILEFVNNKFIEVLSVKKPIK